MGLELKKGVDILTEIGGVKTIDVADKLFNEKLDQESQDKLAKITNEEALLKIANTISMCQPGYVFINTGSAADELKVREMSIEKGEEKKLALNNHTIHFDLPNEQARIVDRTFYIVNEDEAVSSLAKKMLRNEAFDYIKKFMTEIMKGKTLFIGFFSRGPIGAKAAIPALELSSSTYVMHSANILYRSCYESFDSEVQRKGIFYTNIHSEGPNRDEDLPNARVFMDRSWFTTFSMFCTYAGNTLLLKKGNHRFSVDYASYFQKGKELSEHMFITGLTGPGGRKTFFAGAAPSGCGKTTTAMIGSDFIGDDLAQLWIEDDGTLRGINPEKGIFGIVEDVNRQGDPYLMKCLREERTEVIWSNVLIDNKLLPHWLGNGESQPKKGINFQGEWHEGKTDADGKLIPLSHKNSRCTIANESIENYNKLAGESQEGVIIKVITYSGRDSDTMPPVWEAKNPDHGVAIGASIVSAATATELGVTGVKRQPWANAPFIPGTLADYLDAQFNFFNSRKLSKSGRPIMAGLNYFLTHESRDSKGKGLLGEKKDVKVWLSWLERRVNDEVDAIDTAIGYIPKYEDLKAIFELEINKNYAKSLYDMQFSFYIDNIIARIELQKEAYSKEENLSAKLFEVYDEQKTGLLALKGKYGTIVTPEQLIQGV